MRLMRLKEVMRQTALSRSTIYNRMSEGRFPKTVKIGERAVAWLECEIEDWIEEIIQQRD
ncbi:AlpA family phage regulatory protein [Marinomonas flavescens]|uniref:AlpA family phage regulatory protein n=1 Tax=Marinomonas flavescens TaxID=2529379 RepID=UPI001055D3F1|nr:AlpA family phage regulatory protein [Marinomonas flavescens]